MARLILTAVSVALSIAGIVLSLIALSACQPDPYEPTPQPGPSVTTPESAS